MELTAGQQQALEAIAGLQKAFPDGGGIGVISGYAGTGKALAFDQLVQTPNGSATISQLRVGDLVMGSKGVPVKVIGVFPQGVRQSYRVSFRDHASVECDLDHLWPVWTHKKRQSKTQPIVVPLRHILNVGLKMPCGIHRFSIPLCEPLQFDKKTFPMDPYLLGLFIGDGTNLNRTPTLCLPDSEKELVDEAMNRAPLGIQLRVNRAPACPQWRFIDPTMKSNRLTIAFRQLGLAGLLSPQRFIPPQYLRGSVEQRLDLLRGLMDSDGSCSKNRTRFSTKSAALAADVVNLVQSLGGVAIKKLSKRMEWDVNVKTLQNPFRLKRKAAAWSFSFKNPPSRHIINIEPTRMCEHVCIKVDAEDGQFLTESYIVTHNTTLFKTLAENDPHLFILTPTGKAAVRVREVTGAQARTIHSWMYEATEDQETGEVSFGLRELGSVTIPSNGTIIVDEASMVGIDLFKDLYGYAQRMRLNLVFVGDGFQLPPVEMDPAKQGFSVFSSNFPAHFKVNLTEVLRQALDSPVIRCATEVRTGQWVHEGLGVLESIDPANLYNEAASVYRNGGAVICHRNATRHQVNAGVRTKLGLPDGVLHRDEPLMVVTNNHRLEVYNGEIFNVDTTPEVLNISDMAVHDVKANTSVYVNFMGTSINVGGTDKDIVVTDREVFGTLDGVGAWCCRKSCQRMLWAKTPDKTAARPDYVHANLGYCLTAHKAQGSEFDDVLVVMEPSVRLNAREGRQWTYVAVTRAKQRVRICWT